MQAEGGNGDAAAAEIARLTEALAESAELVRAQAAAIAHYRKAYDRASALAKIGVWECELATETLTWSDGVYDLFELPRRSPISRPAVLQMYDEESRSEMERLREQAIREGGSFRLDIRITTALGSTRWLHLTADVEQQDGRAIRIFGTKQDVTEAKAAEEKVKALQSELIHLSRRSAMGAMAATVAHELNQPLAAISNYAVGARRAIEGRKPALDVAGNGLRAIEHNAIRAGMIIRSLRQIVDGSSVRRQPVRADRLFREAGALALSDLPGRATVHYRLAPGIALSVDPVQFQQVLINLIRNAAEAAPAGARGEITVSTHVAGDGVEIHVDDSGPGIDPEILPNVFNAFVSSKPEGMGIGLALSRTIIEAHGGRILAVNRPEGGASFRIVLPLVAEAGDGEAAGPTVAEEAAPFLADLQVAGRR